MSALSNWPTSRSPGHGPVFATGSTPTSRVSGYFATSPPPARRGTPWGAPTASCTAARAWLRRVEWRDRSRPDCNPVERQFLAAAEALADREQRSAEDRARHESRVNKKLRILLAGVAAALVVAIVAGLLALRQADRADRTAELADRTAELAEREAERADRTAEGAAESAAAADGRRRADQARSRPTRGESAPRPWSPTTSTSRC